MLFYFSSISLLTGVCVLTLSFEELPQLRSRTSMELGCDARGYSRAGSDTLTWYCAIIAGRLGAELNKMREVSFFFSMLSFYVLVLLVFLLVLLYSFL